MDLSVFVMLSKFSHATAYIDQAWNQFSDFLNSGIFFQEGVLSRKKLWYHECDKVNTPELDERRIFFFVHAHLFSLESSVGKCRTFLWYLVPYLTVIYAEL